MWATRGHGSESRLWDSSGTHGHSRSNKTPDFRGFWKADEGTRTLDLLHGKDGARADSNRHETSNRLGYSAVLSRERPEVTATDSQTSREPSHASPAATVSEPTKPESGRASSELVTPWPLGVSPRSKLVADALDLARDDIERQRISVFHGCELRSLPPPSIEELFDRGDSIPIAHSGFSAISSTPRARRTDGRRPEPLSPSTVIRASRVPGVEIGSAPPFLRGSRGRSTSRLASTLPGSDGTPSTLQAA